MWLIAVLFLSMVAPLAAQDAERPAYSFLRYNEDWSVLREGEPAGGPDLWDPVKYVPLGESGDVWMSFGGHFQGRGEAWRNFSFGATNDDDFLVYRLLLNADLHVHDWLRAYVELKSAYSTDRDLPGGNRAVDRDPLALEQAFVDLSTGVGGGRGTLRVGRQQYVLGKQRLVSPLPWGNALRRWDGATALHRKGDWTTMAFWSWYAPTQTNGFNETDTDRPLWGVYASGQPAGLSGLDVYYLGYGNKKMPTWNGTVGDETRHTLGARVSGKPGAWDYDVEVAYQLGEVGDGSVSAYMMGSEVGYTLKELGWAPRLLAGFDAGSGDDAPGGDVQTFNQLYPLGHAYLGFADLIGRQNILAPSLGIVTKPARRTSLAVRGFWFRRHSAQDAVYNAAGGVVRAGDLGASKAVASEIDVWLNQGFGRHTAVLVGYSHVFPSDFIKESGEAEPIDFFYVQLKYTF